MTVEAELAGLAQVGVAALFGGVVGLERESRNEPAGLRTHMMVAAASCLIVVLSRELTADMLAVHGDAVRTDPVRMLVAVMTGVGFLGAGTIVSQGTKVRGLTTAGSLLMVSAIGMAVAADRWLLAGSVAIALVFVLSVIGVIERRVRGEGPESRGTES